MHHVPDLVKPSFVIFGIRALWRSDFWYPGTLALRIERQSARILKITNDGLTRYNLIVSLLFFSLSVFAIMLFDE